MASRASSASPPITTRTRLRGMSWDWLDLLLVSGKAHMCTSGSGRHANSIGGAMREGSEVVEESAVRRERQDAGH
jgi:hypothetical protein